MIKKILGVFLVVLVVLLIFGNIFLFTKGEYIKTHLDYNTFIDNENCSELDIAKLEDKLTEIETNKLSQTVVFKSSGIEKEYTYQDLGTTTNKENLQNEIKTKYTSNLFQRIYDYYSQKDLKKEYELTFKFNTEQIKEILYNDFNQIETQGSISYALQENSLEIKIDKKLVLDYTNIMSDLSNGENDIWVGTIEQIPDINEEEVITYLQKNSKKVNTKPKDATLSFVGDEINIVEGYNGKTLNEEKSVQKIRTQLAKGDTLIPLVFDETKPAVSGAELKQKMNNIKVKIGSSTTSFSSSAEGRSTNVRIAAKEFDGVVVAPNEVFSFYEIVGSATKEKGYQIATVFSGGKAVDGIGGGICQVASTVYNAALYANLEIVERHNHGLPVGYVKPSLDATVSSGVLDLKIRNTTGGYIYIRTNTANKQLTVDIYGEEKKYDVELTSNILNYIEPTVKKTFNASLPAGTEKVVAKGSSGYKSEGYRIVKQNGEIIKKEKLSTDTYRATVKEIEYNDSVPENIVPTE